MYLSIKRFGVFPFLYIYICISIQVLYFLICVSICAICIDIRLGRFKTTGGPQSRRLVVYSKAVGQHSGRPVPLLRNWPPRLLPKGFLLWKNIVLYLVFKARMMLRPGCPSAIVVQSMDSRFAILVYLLADLIEIWSPALVKMAGTVKVLFSLLGYSDL